MTVTDCVLNMLFSQTMPAMENVSVTPLKLPALVLLFAVIAIAQIDRANITGTVRDSSGGVVNDSTVTVSYAATGLLRQVKSNGSGAFLLANLPLGHVTIDVAKPGFRTARTE